MSISDRIAKIKAMLLSPKIPGVVRMKYEKELLYLGQSGGTDKIQILCVIFNEPDDAYYAFIGKKKTIANGYAEIGVCHLKLKESRAIMEDAVHVKREELSINEKHSREWMDEIYAPVSENELLAKYNWQYALLIPTFEIFLFYK